MTDLRFALRTLSKSPGFALATAGLLAAGIGATVLLYSVLDAVVLRPLPARHPEQLVRVVQHVPRVGTASRFFTGFYEILRDRSSTFSAAFGEFAFDTAMTQPAPAEQIRVHFPTPEFFDALGVRALYGRALTEEDAKESSGRPPAVLSYAFWQRRFQGDPNAVGKTIVLHDSPFVIVGVLPREFNGLAVDTAPDVRVPLRTLPLITTVLGRNGEYAYVDLAGRLRPGITIARARSECAALWQAFTETYEKDPIRSGMTYGPGYPLDLDPLVRGTSILRDRYGSALKLLTAGAGFLLLMVCVNVAGLLLARSAARREEIAVRLAVGATRLRLVRQMLVESLLLAILGAAGGVLLAAGVAPLLGGLLPPIRDLGANRLPLTIHLGVDLRVLLFSLAVSLLTVLLFGLLPAVSASRETLESVLRGARSSRRWGSQPALIVFQIALCTLLLTGTGLLLRTFQKLRATDPGFESGHVVTLTINPEGSGYNRARGIPFVQLLTERVRQIPGVQSVGLAERGVLRDRGLAATVVPAGQRATPADFLNTNGNGVSPGYFETMGLRLLAGRTLTDSDKPETKPEKVVVNQAFVRHFYPDTDPLGQRFGGADAGQLAPEAYEIVGVVTNAKYRSLREPIMPAFYEPDPYSGGQLVLHARTFISPESIIQPLRQALAALDPAMPVIEIETLAAEMDSSSSSERLSATLGSLFGALAAALTAAGIYGLFAYAVVQRRREIGIRMAVGATAANIGAMLGRQAFTMATTGVALGLGAALLTDAWIGSLLYGVTPSDPWSLTAAAGAVISLTIAAVAPAVYRAVRVDPASALRAE